MTTTSKSSLSRLWSMQHVCMISKQMTMLFPPSVYQKHTRGSVMLTISARCRHHLAGTGDLPSQILAFGMYELFVCYMGSGFC